MVILRLFHWFAFLGEGQEASNGIYPVILYYKDFDELVLAYGISDTNEPHAQWQFSSDIPKTIAEYFQATSGVYPKKYGQSYYACSQKVSQGIDYTRFASMLDNIINDYKLIFNSGKSVIPPMSKTESYCLEDALNDLFIPETTIETILKRLTIKKYYPPRAARRWKNLCCTPSGLLADRRKGSATRQYGSVPSIL